MNRLAGVFVLLSVFCIQSFAGEKADFRHVVVYQEDGIFAAWPANNGAWIWEDDEIVVGFTIGEYKQVGGHNIGEEHISVLARSKDGGVTWAKFDPENYVGDVDKVKDLVGPVDFTHEGFMMKVEGNAYHGHDDGEGSFFVSYDRGGTWEGPYRFSGLADDKNIKGVVKVNVDKWEDKLEASKTWKEYELTPRTDYLVKGKNECMLLMSARPMQLQGEDNFATDRLFCVRTIDGGKSFNFVSWVVGPSDPSRAVMSQTVRVDDKTMVTVMRRRRESNNWIDTYISRDGGESWSFQAKAGSAGRVFNGNPPALVKTDDGRLCCVFGNREKVAIMASYSSDNGKSWTEPFAIRSGDYWAKDDDADLGYPRLVKRSDGSLVAIYYWSTKEALHNISATIWKP